MIVKLGSYNQHSLNSDKVFHDTKQNINLLI